ncbi:hypothetical protein ACLOJK_032340 [Asimina triloba]
MLLMYYSNRSWNAATGHPLCFEDGQMSTLRKAGGTLVPVIRIAGNPRLVCICLVSQVTWARFAVNLHHWSEKPPLYGRQICQEEKKMKVARRFFMPMTEQNSDSDSSQKERKITSKKEKDRRKKKNDCYDSSDGEEVEKLSKGSKRRKKWYSSDASSSILSESETDSDSNHSGEEHQKRRTNTREGKQRKERRTKHGKKSKKRSKSQKEAFSYDSLSENYSDGDDGHHHGGNDKPRKRSKREKEKSKERKDRTDDGGDFIPQDNKGLARKEMGLEWMLKPMNQSSTMSTQSEDPLEEKLDEIELSLPNVKRKFNVKKPNPRELNPYLRDNGSGYPDDDSQTNVDAGQLPSHLVIGDGGVSWRLKALKRAQEQAAREGRKLDEVVAERWGSLGNLAVSAASHSAAHAHAHLHAIRDRKRGLSEKQEYSSADQSENTIKKVSGNKGYLQDNSVRHHEMREPKVRDSLTWGKRKATKMSPEDTQLISSAAKHINKYANDGGFLDEFKQQQNNDASGSRSPISATNEGNENIDIGVNASKDGHSSQGGSVIKQAMTANQLAAKVLQLRMKGKIEEAEKLQRETEVTTVEQESKTKAVNDRTEGMMSRYSGRISSSKQKKDDQDADMHLARTIMKNKQYSISGQVDDEYDFDGAPSKKQSRKRERIPETGKSTIAKRFLTQQDRCQFCFENPSRPKHLVMSIANFTYLMLPQLQPIVPGHCYILPMQEKDVIFLETVMGLAKQRRHCMVECIPLPLEVAKEAPLYFKKAIDEAEDEWSQHNAKKLIDTSEKGLRASIPKDFPYFHVEFGLNQGFVHVIDDETQFKSNLGLNVIRGMLRLPEEDMYRRQKHESVETQKQAVAMFEREWEPFDWTKQLD